MELKNSQYQKIIRMYEQKQLLSHDLLLRRYEEVCEKIPEFRFLDPSISTLSIQYGKRLLDGDNAALDSLRKELALLRDKKQLLLKEAGFPANYLEPVYECPDCCDTGYIGNEKCHCFKKAVIQLLYERSDLREILQQENFDTFSLSYYSEHYIDPKSGRSSLSVMKEALSLCRRFADNLAEQHQNLFLYGSVGVGKTFLSHCIAKAAIDSGFSVLYFSAPSLFSTIARDVFDKNPSAADSINGYIYSCDLLIIDDLGTELTNSFVVSQFFTCINERLLQKKSTVISTNLSLDALADLYTERSFSRITSNYIMLKLIGDDIRIKKKLLAGRNDDAASK